MGLTIKNLTIKNPDNPLLVNGEELRQSPAPVPEKGRRQPPEIDVRPGNSFELWSDRDRERYAVLVVFPEKGDDTEYEDWRPQPEVLNLKTHYPPSLYLTRRVCENPRYDLQTNGGRAILSQDAEAVAPPAESA